MTNAGSTLASSPASRSQDSCGNSNETVSNGAELQAVVQPDAPIGSNGSETGRDVKSGRFARGNTFALSVGHRSRTFQKAHEAAREAIVAGVVTDAGFALDDAPVVLLKAAEAFAQSVLISTSAYERIAFEGGPTTASGRVRRVFNTWQQASGRVEAFARLLGTARKPKVMSLDEMLAMPTEQAR
jgi:hypothetical protein